ncbi:hypothetical protein PR003_g10833 [Phytophthora rubi]|uniref:Uncharacterized protein n=2 Tax=Phytophthora TaxID=4783 RepID=A0A6A3MD29_9STRA|nr:hypothetical protein PR002_g9929 [Phytophthora rubi]KAE9034483.1 hypothetical protein PR001_g9708 [Phytophthora rubi]KAE9339786.1 hypothetical protein PR003_g10833 [Phytophthora rubi]
MPTLVDYTSIDMAMKSLKIPTKWPEAESRTMHLQADIVAIINRFNVTDLAFRHEQRRELPGSRGDQSDAAGVQAVEGQPNQLWQVDRGAHARLHDLGTYRQGYCPLSHFQLGQAWRRSNQRYQISGQAGGEANNRTGERNNRRCGCGWSGLVGVDMEAQVDIVAELEVMSLEFTYGWRIITVLGNSADELLVRARDTKSEWELGDTGEPGQMSRLRRSSVSAECRHAWETSRCI